MASFYGELAAMKASDYSADARAVHVPFSKSGPPPSRHAYGDRFLELMRACGRLRVIKYSPAIIRAARKNNRRAHDRGAENPPKIQAVISIRRISSPIDFRN